jgi:hypothetical protein
VYGPVVLGVARVTFSDRKLGVDDTRDVLYAAPITSGAVPVDWTAAERLPIGIDDLDREPRPEVPFAPLPGVAAQPRQYAAWQKAFARWVAQNERVELLRHPTLGITARPGETERDFRIRLQLEVRAARDAAIDAVRRKYAGKQAALAERLKRAELSVHRETQQAADQKVQTAVSFGATVLGAILGRKAVSTGTLGRATTAARGVGRSMKEAAEVKRAAEAVESVKRSIQKLDDQIAADAAAVSATFDAEAPLSTVVVAPRRGHVEVQVVALLWRPVQRRAAVNAAETG